MPCLHDARFDLNSGAGVGRGESSADKNSARCAFSFLPVEQAQAPWDVFLRPALNAIIYHLLLSLSAVHKICPTLMLMMRKGKAQRPTSESDSFAASTQMSAYDFCAQYT